MKPCNHWREELADHVLGAPAGPALSAHLEQCPACSSALREWQARIRKVDDAIRQLAASEPFADAASRVLTDLRSRRRSGIWVPQWKTAAAAFAGFAILAATLTYAWWTREQRKETDRVLSAAGGIASWKSPTQGLLRSPDEFWRKRPPRLGEYFYELKPDVLKIENLVHRGKEREDP